MKEYISKIVQIRRDSTSVFAPLADMRLLAQAALAAKQDEIEDVVSDIDYFSFTAKGLTMGVQIIEREEFKTIKYAPYGTSPFDYKIWIQLKEVAPTDTRMRIVLHVKLNMAMKLLLKGKIQKGLDSFADQFSASLNG